MLVNGDRAIWNDKKRCIEHLWWLGKEGDVEIMSVPFYDIYTAYAKQYTVFGSTAQYYILSHNENVDNWFTYSGWSVRWRLCYETSEYSFWLISYIQVLQKNGIHVLLLEYSNYWRS